MENPELKSRSLDSKHMLFPLKFAIQWSALCSSELTVKRARSVWAIRPPSSDLGSAALNNEDPFHGQFLALSFRNCYWWHQLLWVMVLNDRGSQWLQLLVTIPLYIAACHDSQQHLLLTVVTPSCSCQQFSKDLLGHCRVSCFLEEFHGKQTAQPQPHL